jgi:hypothetical protein
VTDTGDTGDDGDDYVIPATHEWSKALADGGTSSRPTFWVSRTHSQHWVGPYGEKDVPMHVVMKSDGTRSHYIVCADSKLADAIEIVDALRAAVDARTRLRPAHRLAQVIYTQLGEQPTTRQLYAVAGAIGVDLAAVAWTYDGCL